jgi:glutamine synthetase
MACGCNNKEKENQMENQMENQPPQPPQPQKYKLEYIWLDGNETKGIRSKVRYASILSTNGTDGILSSIPSWTFDGSSTNQATTENSDCVLKPVRVFQNPMESRQIPSLFVFCEVFNIDGTPHESNTRAKLKSIMESTKDLNMWVGIEQEFTVMDPKTNKPYGWGDETPEQGEYYCGVGSIDGRTRQLTENHMGVCLQVGIAVDGVHPEVMKSQFEYQVGVGSPIDMSDQLWMSRFLLQKMAERMELAISYEPKLYETLNGSGAHINFSTRYMREEADISYMNILCSGLGETHKRAIEVYGEGNEKRLTGKHETSSVDNFTWGESDRSASIRIPVTTINNNGRGYLEDRRPSANMDPYMSCGYLLSALSHINEDMMATS